eukprot:48222-Eustigmatos_ZCMA.PRE.1
MCICVGFGLEVLLNTDTLLLKAGVLARQLKKCISLLVIRSTASRNPSERLLNSRSSSAAICLA